MILMNIRKMMQELEKSTVIVFEYQQTSVTCSARPIIGQEFLPVLISEGWLLDKGLADS